MDYVVYVWLGLFTAWLFVVGCAVGSFLNVVIYRLPRGKALTWPSSRCGACLAPIRLLDNVPLLSYWRLRGRCRACGARFSMRYFWVEAATGAVFAGLYWAEIGWNLHGLPLWGEGGAWYLSAGMFPPWSWTYYLFHVLLASLLIAALGCLADAGALPRPLVATGAATGLLFAALFPWPTPLPAGMFLAAEARPFDGPQGEGYLRGPMPSEGSWAEASHSPRPGFVPWPVWGPLPLFLPERSAELGLLTGLAGVLGWAWLLRGLGALQRRQTGEDHLTLASGVVVMTGGFLGWQPVLLAVFIAAVITLVATQFGRRGAPTFAAALVAGVVVAWLGWPWLGPWNHRLLFDPAGAGSLILGTALSAAAFTWPARPRLAPPSGD